MYNLENLKNFNAEQKKAVLHDDGNIIISASAGSGKTRTMIERIFRLVCEEKATIKEILAVTFTDSSALDMKRKLKEKLIEQIKAGESIAKRELGDVATADICTLHSFCGKLCRTYFYAVKLSPDFKIIDESEAEGLKEECLNRTLKSFYEKHDESFLQLARQFSLKRSDRVLREIIIKVYDNLTAEVDKSYYAKKLDEVYGDSGFSKMLSANKEFINLKLKSSKKLAEDGLNIARANCLSAHQEFFENLLADIEILRSGDLDEIDKIKSVKRSLPRNKIPEDLKYVQEDAKSVRDDIEKLKTQFCSRIRTKDVEYADMSTLKATTETLLGVVDKFTEEYEAQKREDNCLDFDDLMSLSLEILQDEQIASEVRSKYKYVFVDEYQDINGIQEAILLKLSQNNLFMVGDPKQSIYGFRGCRPEIFEQKFERMEKNGETAIRLNANYRCSKSVIDMTNDVFSFCMTKEFYGNDYAKNSMLVEGRDFDGKNLGRAKLFMIDSQKDKEKEIEEARIYDVLEESLKVKEKKANEISLLVSNIIRNELTKKYLDKNTGQEKFITFGDICILTRNKENAYVCNLVNGLIRRGVPVASLVEQNICDFPEVSVLINLLKLIDNFKQNIPLAVVLKSAIGGFSEEELAEIVLKYADDGKRGEFLDAYFYYLTNGEGQLQTRLREFDDFIKKLRFKADFIGAKGVLDSVINEKFYVEHLLATPLGTKKADRVRRFVSLCTNNGCSLTVYEALEKIEHNKKAFGMAEETEENAVKVQTIHSSKGLEYPVVIVCGLENRLSQNDAKEQVLFDREWGIAVSSFDDDKKTYCDTLLRTVILEKQQIDEIKEEERLFYVAMTRAQHALYLTCDSKEDSRQAVFQSGARFIDFIPSDINIENEMDSASIFEQPLRAKKVLISKTNVQMIKTFNDRFNYFYPFNEDTVLPLKNSVTQIVSGQKESSLEQNAKLEQAILDNSIKLEQCEDDTLKVVVLDDELLTGSVDLSQPITDRERGIIAHKILENYDFCAEKDFFIQVKEMISKNVLTEKELENVDLDRICFAISSGVFDCAKTRKVFKEKSFLVNVPAKEITGSNSTEQVLMQGVIDFLAVGSDDAVIIDYKYSKANDETLLKRYFKQLELYSVAVEKILRKKVVKKAIVNIYNGQTVIV